MEILNEILEFDRVTLGNNPSELINYYKTINNDFGVLIQEIYDQKETWAFAGDLEGKLIRIFFQNESILRIAGRHYPILKGQRLDILDINSIYALSRQLIESLLTTYYLFFDDISKSDLTIRILTYKLAGLIRQLDLVNEIDHSDLRLSSLKEEKNSVVNEIMKTLVYKSADQKNRQKLLNPRKAILKSREDLIIDLNMPQLIQTWSLYSNYVHSEYISDRQFNDFYRNRIGLIESVCTTLNSNCRITAKLIFLMKNKFSYMQGAFENLPLVNKFRIDLWNKISV